MKRPLNATDVPPHLMESAYLLGHIPQMALQSDPRVSYSLYIPAEPYNTLATSSPTTSQPAPKKLPLLVHIHGTRRSMAAMYTDLKKYADATPCAILAPLFPAGIEGPNNLDSYKKLSSKSLKSGLALLSMLDEISTRWPLIETQKVYLMGFSGGGQFAHRFLYLWPDRLAAASIGAPGQVTLLDPTQKWPKGVQNVQEIFSRDINIAAIKKVRIQLLVGGNDTTPHGGKDFSAWQQNMKKQLDQSETEQEATSASLTPSTQEAVEGVGRLGTLKKLHEMWGTEGIQASFEVVPGVAHSADGVRKSGLEFLRPLMQG